MQSFLQAAKIQRNVQNDRITHKHEPTQSPSPNLSYPSYLPTSSPDPLNPQSWPLIQKLLPTAFISLIAFTIGLASSVDTGVLPQISASFAISPVSATLSSTAVFLFGMALGAPFAGPLSETYGRNPVYISSMALFCCWILGAALARNIGEQLVFRFLAGISGSTPLTASGGTMADLWDHRERGRVFPVFACVAFVGPMVGPVVGGYIGGREGLSWRWTEWVSLIVGGTLLLGMVGFMKETHAPTLLGWRERAMRRGDLEGGVKREGRIEEQGIWRKISVALARPFVILSTEPIVVAFTLYLSLVYAVAFSFFTSAPFIFGGTYGFGQGASYLMFASIVVGLVVCLMATPLFGILVGREFRKAAAEGKAHADPEAMLVWAMVGAPFLPTSLFWMGWTAYPSISYWAPLISAAFFGFSILCIFISTYAYLVQSYATYAASSLVAITLVRYTAGGAMTIVSIPMYENLGVHYSLTVLGSIACAFTPIPYILYFYGHKLRQSSSRTVEPSH